MYAIMLLSLAFYTIGTVLFVLDLVKRRQDSKNAWLDENVWLDAQEWDNRRFNSRKSRVNLSL